MRKRNVFILVVAITTIVQMILGDFLIRDFSPLLSFVLLVPFYMILFLYYRKYRQILLITVISIFALLSSVYLWYYYPDYGVATAKIRLIGRFSYLLGIAENIACFLLVLQNRPKSKTLKGLFVFIALSHYVFFSYYQFPIDNILIGIFGPNPADITTLFIVIQILVYIFKVLILISQLILIYLLDKDAEQNIII